MPHVAESNITACVKGGINFGVNTGLLEDGDLTSLATAKAAVDTDNAKLHTSQKLFGVRVKSALDLADNYLAGFTSGSDASDIDAISNAGNGRSPRF